MDTAKQRTRRHTFVRLGALWLLGVGLLQSAIGTWLLVEPMEPCQTAACSFGRPFVLVFTLPLLALGAGHVVAFVGVWRWRGWGQVLGILFAVLGLLVSIPLLDGADPWWRSMYLPAVLAVGYVVTLVALVYWVPSEAS